MFQKKKKKKALQRYGCVLSDSKMRVHYFIFPSVLSKKQPLGGHIVLERTGIFDRHCLPAKRDINLPSASPVCLFVFSSHACLIVKWYKIVVKI